MTPFMPFSKERAMISVRIRPYLLILSGINCPFCNQEKLKVTLSEVESRSQGSKVLFNTDCTITIKYTLE